MALDTDRHHSFALKSKIQNGPIILVSEEPRIRVHHLLDAGRRRTRPRRRRPHPRRKEDRPEARHPQEQEQSQQDQEDLRRRRQPGTTDLIKLFSPSFVAVRYTVS
jgi:hypothetical protein